MPEEKTETEIVLIDPDDPRIQSAFDLLNSLTPHSFDNARLFMNVLGIHALAQDRLTEFLRSDPTAYSFGSILGDSIKAIAATL